MNGNTFSYTGTHRIIPLLLVLGLVIGCAAPAFAQTSAEGQYSDPTSTASGNPAASGNPTSAATPAGGTASKASGGGGVSGASKGGGGAAGIKLLPATGGPLPLLIGLGALALGSTGLLALRRAVR